MIAKECPICETNKYSKVVYTQNLPTKNNQIDFSGRKNPDGFHYEMIRCFQCNLLYAKEIYEENFSNNLYEESEFSYDDELTGLKKTYLNCLKEACNDIKKKENFLEIGCGNGFMLKEASNLGFKFVQGVEPSKNAYLKSPEELKEKILQKIFDHRDFKDNFFDIVFIAMIVEHVVDINKFLKDIQKILKPGGKVVCICHNERHFLSKILKSKHPIINDEHLVVFGKTTLKKIFTKHNYTNVNVSNLQNFYSVKYWCKMLPLNYYLKKFFSKALSLFSLDKKIVGIKAGNLYLIADKKS